MVDVFCGNVLCLVVLDGYDEVFDEFLSGCFCDVSVECVVGVKD